MQEPHSAASDPMTPARALESLVLSPHEIPVESPSKPAAPLLTSSHPVTSTSANGKDASATERNGKDNPQAESTLPMPPWITTVSDPEAYEQLIAYASKLEMDTALLLAQVIAQLICATQHVAWILCRGPEGCAPLDVHGEVAVKHARRLLDDAAAGVQLTAHLVAVPCRTLLAPNAGGWC